MNNSYVKESFSYWAMHPEDLAEGDIAPLQEVSKEYPFCQSLHILVAKAMAQYQPNYADKCIQKAAAYTISRSALRKLIQNEFEWSSHVQKQHFDNVLIWPHDYPNPQPIKAYTHNKWQLPELPKIAILEEIDVVIEQINRKNIPEVPPIDDTTLRESTLQDELERIDNTLTWETLREAERQQQMDIIDSFIENENKIGPIRANLNDATINTEQEDLAKKRNSQISSSIVSEGMAKIMAKQGKIEKAIEIYEQLILKKPEKKAYFAEKIKELTT